MCYIRPAMYPSRFEIPAHLLPASRAAIYRAFCAPRNSEREPSFAQCLYRAPKPSLLQAPYCSNSRTIAFIKGRFARFYYYCHPRPDRLQFGPPQAPARDRRRPLHRIAPAVHRVLRGAPLRLRVNGRLTVPECPSGASLQEIRPLVCARRRKYASCAGAPPPPCVAPSFSRSPDACRHWTCASPNSRLWAAPVFSGFPRARS